jgi:hypothetical protein
VPALPSGERVSDIVRFQVLIAMSMKTAVKVKKVKQSRYTPWRRLGGEKV